MAEETASHPGPAAQAIPPGGAAGVEARPQVPGLGRFLVSAAGIFALAVPTVGLIVIAAAVVSSVTGFFAYIFAFVAVVALVLIASAARRIRDEQQGRLLGYLEVATRLNLPLPEFLDALRAGEGRAIGVRAGRLADDMRLGIGLGESMFVRTPEVPVHQAALIWRGERAGRLRDAVARAADNRRRAIRDSRASESGSGMQYALTVMVVLLGLVGLVGIKIIPKYIEIFEDFETELPWVTRMMFEWAGVFGPLLVLTGGVAMLGIIGWSTYGLFYSAEGVAGPLRRWLEPVWWRVPVLSHSTRSRALADACFTIEQAMRAGRPLPEAIDAARHPAQSGVLDRRLRRLAEGLRRGRPLPDAARAARLPALVVGMLGTASAASDPADVFAFLCRYYTHRVSPAEAVLRAAALPVLTLVMAAAVAWFVFAVFYPLIVLIERCIDVTGYA